MWVSCIFVGAGRGKRLRKKDSKAFLNIKGKPLIYYTLQRFLGFPRLKEFILVVRKKDLKKADRFSKRFLSGANVKIACGGARRAHSVRRGLDLVDPRADYILVHDIARPFIKRGDIKKLLKNAPYHEGCALGAPTSRTLKETKVTSKGIKIVRTLRRENLYDIFTPQIFKKDILIKSYRQGFFESALDDSQICESFADIYIVEAEPSNIKVTYPWDVALAKILLK